MFCKVKKKKLPLDVVLALCLRMHFHFLSLYINCYITFDVAFRPRGKILRICQHCPFVKILMICIDFNPSYHSTILESESINLIIVNQSELNNFAHHLVDPTPEQLRKSRFREICNVEKFSRTRLS